jgi:hypothetical protein
MKFAVAASKSVKAWLGEKSSKQIQRQ